MEESQSCRSSPWGNCQPSPGTGTCQQHVDWAINHEGNTCHSALRLVKSQCPSCDVCDYGDCPTPAPTPAPPQCVSAWYSENLRCPHGQVFLGHITVPNNRNSLTLSANVAYSAMPFVVCAVLLLQVLWVVVKRHVYRGGALRQYVSLTRFLFALRYLLASGLAIVISFYQKSIFRYQRPVKSCLVTCGMPDEISMWAATLMTCMFLDLIFKWSVPHLTASVQDSPPAYTEEQMDRLGYTPIRPSSFLYRSTALLIFLGPVPTARIVLGDASFPEMAAGFAQGIVLGLLIQVASACVLKAYGGLLWKHLFIPIYRHGLFGSARVASTDKDFDDDIEDDVAGGDIRQIVDQRLGQQPLGHCFQCCNWLLSKLPGLEFLDVRADVIVGELDEQARALEDRINDMLCTPPPTWKWKGGGICKHQLVAAPQMESKIREMLKYTKHARGCTGTGDSTWISRIKSIKVSRLEHPMLWTEYASRKMTMKQQVRAYKIQIPPLQPPLDGHETLDPSVNEVYLWHGTGKDSLDDILQWGLDERVCSVNGLYGAGLYFACDICKSGQYAKPAGNVRYVFYSRVLLGLPSYADEYTQGARRPPAYSEKNGRLYDSVIANTEHREFIVYDRLQTYPEYLLEFHV